MKNDNRHLNDPLFVLVENARIEANRIERIAIELQRGAYTANCVDEDDREKVLDELESWRIGERNNCTQHAAGWLSGFAACQALIRMQQVQQKRRVSYPDTIEEAKEKALLVLTEKEGVLVDSSEFDDWLSEGGLSHETSSHLPCQAVTIKGRPSRKTFNISIYRLHSGRYEVNAYVS